MVVTWRGELSYWWGGRWWGWWGWWQAVCRSLPGSPPPPSHSPCPVNLVWVWGVKMKRRSVKRIQWESQKKDFGHWGEEFTEAKLLPEAYPITSTLKLWDFWKSVSKYEEPALCLIKRNLQFTCEGREERGRDQRWCKGKGGRREAPSDVQVPCQTKFIFVSELKFREI